MSILIIPASSSGIHRPAYNSCLDLVCILSRRLLLYERLCHEVTHMLGLSLLATKKKIISQRTWDSFLFLVTFCKAPERHFRNSAEIDNTRHRDNKCVCYCYVSLLTLKAAVCLWTRLPFLKAWILQYLPGCWQDSVTTVDRLHFLARK